MYGVLGFSLAKLISSCVDKCYSRVSSQGHTLSDEVPSNNLTAMMVKQIAGKSLKQNVWDIKPQHFCRGFVKGRRRISENLSNPNLLKISTKTFRHWKATM